MSITPQFTMLQVQDYMLKNIERYEQTILDALRRTGEKAVAYMRSLRTYKDRTTNLRSSAGYAIYKDGSQVGESFTGSAEGVQSSKAICMEVAAQYAPSKGFLLVVTAGMEYAIYVEAKGYDVITGGSKEASKFIKDRMQKIHRKISK